MITQAKLPKISVKTEFLKNETLVILLDSKFSDKLSKISKYLGIEEGKLSKKLKDIEFGTKKTKTFALNDLDLEVKKVFFLETELSDLELELTGAKIADISSCCEKLSIVNFTESKDSKILNLALLGLCQKLYRFSKYLTTEKAKESLPKLLEVVLVSSENIDTKEVVATLESINIVKDLVNEVPNVLYPQSYAEYIQELFKGTDVKLTILNETEMKKLGMNTLLAVGMGSEKKPYTVIMEYNGNKSSKETEYALVGKGVTFDSGGMSIKPASGMEDMKGDMAGSATVVASLLLASKLGVQKNIVGAIGLVENMINGIAQRPGDIVVSMSGQTVEVLNTDAEGRLVLGDVLYYVATKHKPQKMIDFATLTGAIVVALGDLYAGYFSNSDEFAKEIFNAAETTGELCWRLPLHKEYNKLMDSKIADMRNTGSVDRMAGSITAAQFLQRFIEKTPHWVHIDIAGVSDSNRDKPLYKSGAAGWGVKLIKCLFRA